MNKDQVAIYLNEHPEFFNEYPELLREIKEIEEEDLPIEPMSTLSLADRIIKRVHDDKEHLKSKLEWLFEISRANEKIQDHLYEIEQLVLTSTNLDQMVSQLRKEIPERFGIPSVIVCLVQGSDHFMEDRLRERYQGELDETVKFICKETASIWFDGELKPVLRGKIEDSEVFGPPNSEKYQDVLRMPDYRRVDIGFSAILKSENKRSRVNFMNVFNSAWLSVEVFNLLDINNTISYLWVSDIGGRQYAVPNYLTRRQVNLKLILRF